MNFLKEAQSAFDFATYCPLLYKAIADNDSTTSGYIYEEIIKISFLSHQHRVHLVDFLLVKLSNLGWSGKQKVVRILLQLCQRGHFEVRVILRRRDGELRKAASQGGPPDPVLANTPQLFFNSLIQELLSYIFDGAIVKTDEDLMAKGEDASCQGPALGSSGGYGSSGTQGKYEGFGNTPITRSDSLVDQVREMMEKVVTPESRRRKELEGLMKGDRGNYQPLSLNGSSITAPQSLPSTLHASAGPPLFSSMVSPRTKAHVAGRPGGGWDSDDDKSCDDATITNLRQMTIEGGVRAQEPVEEEPHHTHFLQKLLERHNSWPVDLEEMVASCKESTVYNPFKLLQEWTQRVKDIMSKMEEVKEQENAFLGVNEEGNSGHGCGENADNFDALKQNLVVLLLFIEFGLYEDLLSVNLLHSHVESLLMEVASSKLLNPVINLKAKKICLCLKALSCY